jgi:hypothetical protein
MKPFTHSAPAANAATTLARAAARVARSVAVRDWLAAMARSRATVQQPAVSVREGSGMS